MSWDVHSIGSVLEVLAGHYAETGILQMMRKLISRFNVDELEGKSFYKRSVG